MTTLTRVGLIAFVSTVAGFAFPGSPLAHHSGPGGGGPWAWLGALVLVLVFLVAWTASVLLERRNKPRSERQPPDGKP